MGSIHSSFLSEVCEAIVLQKNAVDKELTELLSDSRQFTKSASTLFIAIPGRLDGHDYIQELYNKGVRYFLTEKPFDLSKVKEATVWKVDSTLTALQLLATNHRSKFSYPVLGITGSNGKTIVKEFVYQLLREQEHIIRSPKSFNSQLGVPLSVWMMEESNTLAVLEAGISKSGEMEKLEKIINPTYGIFTNIGDAHDEGFENEREKIQEKLKLFSNSQLLIIPHDQKIIFDVIVEKKKQGWNTNLQLLSWGQSEGADLQIIQTTIHSDYTEVKLKYRDNIFNAELGFSDTVSIQNAITALLFGLNRNYPIVDLLRALRQLSPVAMRLELREAIHQSAFINDAYNSDIYSLKIALDFMVSQKYEKRTVILSDILQSKKEPLVLYTEIAEMLKAYGVQSFIGIGEKMVLYKNAFHLIPQTSFYESTERAVEGIEFESFNQELILLKGARDFAFERIARRLEQKVHDTVLEINLSHFSHNLREYRNLLPPQTKIMAMVKAFSYGSGSFEVASWLQSQRVDYLAVAYADEGVALRKAGIELPIMVMNTEERSVDLCIHYKLEPCLFSIHSYSFFTTVLERIKPNFQVPIHLEIESGMHRLGFERNDFVTVLQDIKSKGNIRVASVFSHLASSEDAKLDGFTKQQISTFNSFCKEAEEILNYKFLKHIANSHGASRHNEASFDMVRLGIGLYGVDFSEALKGKLKLVSCWKSRISQIKKVSKNETVGYNRRGVLQRDSLIATIALGYADGYSRRLGHGNGVVYINGIAVKTTGTICMDMCMVDVTELENVNEGDEVIIFENTTQLLEMATAAETIPYEILTGISQRVKRMYYQE